MQTREKPERFFSLELNSKNQIKSMSLPDDAGKESTLIEGTIGKLVEATFTEDIILEVRGTEGTLRIDLQAKEFSTTQKGGN